MQNSVELDFADGRYLFKLGMRQICELEEKCKCGIGEIAARCLSGYHGDLGAETADLKFSVYDVTETIRLGLIGGKTGWVDGAEIAVKPHDAKALVDRYVMEQPLIDGWQLACVILLSCVHGYEPPKKKAAESPIQPDLTGAE